VSLYDLPESALARVAERYRTASRVERCACGATITATGGSDAEIVAAVRTHQTRPRHRAWWKRQESKP
jgi:hypothetical protein